MHWNYSHGEHSKRILGFRSSHKAKRKGDRVVGIVDRIPRKVEKSLWYFDSGEVFHLRIRSTDTKT